MGTHITDVVTLFEAVINVVTADASCSKGLVVRLRLIIPGDLNLNKARGMLHGYR